MRWCCSNMPDPTLDLPFAWGTPAGAALVRRSPEDFQVEEIPLVTPSGSGEHVFLSIRKRNCNTADLALQIARLAQVHPRNVSFAGLKDRNAVTAQTFSVHLPGKAAPDWSALESADIQVLGADRHQRKLRRGALKGNRFRIMMRNFQGNDAVLQARVEQIAHGGVPNYYGPQRFGIEGRNLDKALALLRGQIRRVNRNQRSLWLSAARSWLFNRVLAARVQAGSWNRMLSGDVLQKNGGNGQFMADPDDSDMLKRLQQGRLHPSAPLVGRPGRCLQAADEALDIEQNVLDHEKEWTEGLESMGLDADRRALRVNVEDLQCRWDGMDIELQFSLNKGSYATAVLRELVRMPVHSSHLSESRT